MVRPLVNLPVGCPWEGLKSIPYGGESAFERVNKKLLLPTSTRESPNTNVAAAQEQKGNTCNIWKMNISTIVVIVKEGIFARS